MITPDEPTKKRIKYLAIVGNALHDTYSDDNMENGSDFFYALDALKIFEEGIDLLELDTESHDGMKALIEYLRGKINRRMGYVGK